MKLVGGIQCFGVKFLCKKCCFGVKTLFSCRSRRLKIGLIYTRC